MIKTSGKDISQQKTKKDYFCGFYKKGNCPFGENCHSSHESSIRKFISIPCKFFLKNEECKNGKNCWFAHYIPNNYKTKMCESFLYKGICPQMNQCCFAHSKEELRLFYSQE